MYFRKKLMESKQFEQIGSWWQAKQDDPCEADIVAIYAEEKKHSLFLRTQKKSYIFAAMKIKIWTLFSKKNICKKCTSPDKRTRNTVFNPK